MNKEKKKKKKKKGKTIQSLHLFQLLLREQTCALISFWILKSWIQIFALLVTTTMHLNKILNHSWASAFYSGKWTEWDPHRTTYNVTEFSLCLA